MNLSYRKKGLSKALKIRIAILIGIFLVSLIGFIIYFNVDNTVFDSEGLSKSTLPTITVESQGEKYGDFFGYVDDMDIGRMRNGLIPLNEDRKVTYYINTFGNQIKNVSYEICTGDGKRKITKEKVSDLQKVNDTLSAELSLSNLIDEGKEYIMIINLTGNDKKLHYYMRVKYVADGREKECLDFARYFRDTALSTDYQELATYIEPNPQNKGKGNLKVTINSTLGEVGWEGFDIESFTEPKVTFAEIDTSYTSLELRFDVKGNKSTNPGNFKVVEYYRMRKGEERIYLLDFERNIEEELTGSTAKIEKNRLILGQNGEDIDFVSNRTGSNIAFVWGGGLYVYNTNASTLTKVFRFESDNEVDEREKHDEYGIKILDIDENGNLSYSVYGYMNAGKNEGKCGVGLYHYDPIEQVSMEHAFISTNQSFKSLQTGFEGNIFLASAKKMYLNIEDNLICLDFNTERIKDIISWKDKKTYALSKSGRYLASSDANGSEIEVMDLYTEDSFSISPNDNTKKLRVCTFMNEDLVYGEILAEDYNEENIENNIYPISTIIISDIVTGKEQVLKSYSKSGRYITNVSKDMNYILNMELSAKNGDNVFVYAENDTIQNTNVLKESVATLVNVTTDGKIKSAIEFSENSSKAISSKNSIKINGFENLKISYYGGNRKIMYKMSPQKVRYYVYRGMNVISSSDNLSTAIGEAFENAGYCIDNEGNYIWQYGRGLTKKDAEIQKGGEEEKIRINLIGCSLEEVLSYVYRGSVVYVNEGEDDQVIIKGYNQNSITVSKNGMEDDMLIDLAAEQFKNRGNKYSTYILNQ